MATVTREGSSKFAKAGDIQLHYHEAGTGDAVLMLHGGGPGASGWSNFSRNIGPLSERFRVLAIDLPGFGESDRPRYQGGMAEYNARAARGLLDTLGIPKAHLIGNSLGARASVKFALDYPDRTSRLVLMGGGGTTPLLSPAPSEGGKILTSFYEAPGPSVEKMRAFFKVMVYDGSLVSDELVQDRYKAATEPAVAEWYRAMMHRPPGSAPVEELWREYEKIRQPTLIIWGRDDRIMPVDQALFPLQRIPNVRLHIFGRCGHWAQAEKTEEFNRLVTEFLTLGS